MSKYVIIGNAIAATGCIEGIREIDKESEILVISAEKHPAYCRPLISYYLEGKTDLQRMKYRADSYYEDMNVTVLYGKKAVSIDKDAHVITLDSGEGIPYEKICIATGSDPFVPPFEGLDSVANKFSFMTIDDTLALEEAITADSKVLIIGAGLIGLKCAEGIKERVAEITVCDLAPRVLPSIFDDAAASIMQSHLEKNGLKFMLGDSAVKFEGSKAYMKSGAVVDFDVLVLAVGVRPNISLISDLGGNVSRAIVTDDTMETSINDIYAAGDCADSFDVSSQTRKVLAILPNAYMQGKVAGINMAGGDAKFSNAIPMNSIGFFGLHAMTAGTYFNEAEGGELYEESSEGKLKRLFTKDGYLTGFMLIGDTDRAGIYTSLIRNRVPLDTIDYEMIKKSPSLLPFGSEYRGTKLGGVV